MWDALGAAACILVAVLLRTLLWLPTHASVRTMVVLGSGAHAVLIGTSSTSLHGSLHLPQAFQK